MSKIYINNIPVFLRVSETEDFLNNNREIMHVTYRDKKELLDLIRYIEQTEDLKEVHIIGENQSKIENDFFGFYKNIEAAGGLVFDPQGRGLLIFRYGKWDIPKGKIERREAVENAALREVEEETGIDNLVIQQPLLIPINRKNVTYHTYFQRNRRILKITYWFKMYCAIPKEGVPQEEEGITKVKWVEPEHFDLHLLNSWGSVGDVLTAVE
ncbi:MAG: NUDIX domain-containing protein [Chitinophagales bacterium]